MSFVPKEFFTHLHDVECNQKYNKTLPYSFHLEMVFLQGLKFQPLLAKIAQEHYNVTIGREIAQEVQVALWGHDSMEDGRMTYNDIKSLYGEIAAEIIYLCTDFKGKTRKDRKPEQYYTELMTNKLAVFVKLCDIIANIKFGLLANSSMYNKYKEEWTVTKKHFRPVVKDFDEMLIYINKLLAL